jgi:hypothetical protein
MHTVIALGQSLAMLLSGAGALPLDREVTSPVASAQPEKKEAPPASPPAPAKPATPPTPPPSQPPADPATEDVLKEMEKQRGNVPPPSPAPAVPAQGTPPTTAPSPTPAPAAPGVRVQTSAGRLLREGTFLVDRRGRLVRSSTSEWMYTFDTDAKGQADPTMVLMPCQKLEAMEKLAERYGESLTFTVTGQVFVYKNRNYLLPATFRVNRAEGDIKTAQ